MNPAPPRSVAAKSGAAPPRRAGWAVAEIASLTLLGALVLALSGLLWPQWRHNPDLSHGLFVPVIFLVLLNESRTRGPFRYLRPGRGHRVLVAGALVTGLCLVVFGAVYAAALDWSHAIVYFAMTTGLVALLTAGLLTFSAQGVQRIPFNWASCVAIGLWLLSAPLPPGTYSRLTLELQLWVTDVVLHLLHVLGVAATKSGNVIHLANTSVGVEEACSGVRSLISCVFAGFFFSASLVARPWARVVLVGLAVPLAIGMNVLRSLGLTLLADGGVEIEGAWHDATGFAVLGVTALMLGGCALLLERFNPHKPMAPAAVDTGLRPRALRMLAIGLTAVALIAAGLALKARPAGTSAQPGPLPDLAAMLPEHPPGWQATLTEDLFRFTNILQTDHLVQRTYARMTTNGPVELTVYLAYWRAGQASVSLVASHTPDACWPGAGWVAKPVASPRARLALPARALSTAEHRLFVNQGYPQHVWFWHLHGGQPIEQPDPFSPVDLFTLALAYGFRPAEDQLFVRFSSNVPWETLAQDPLVNEIFAQLRPLGL